ncbi:type II secretion system F family protein [Gryllotalpicola ginsengisoli]|uniref:type II secretion system F family protein n=1 Tax=Gryllotalpicola ginsengisoli TaxID=444608 RepID=UPI0003B66DE4|nr:membrane protein [Gryllotalpicola ginsengisoli]
MSRATDAPAPAPRAAPARSTADALEEVAAIAQRLGVLLAAGVTPERAWAYVAETADDAEAAARDRSAGGPPVGGGRGMPRAGPSALNPGVVVAQAAAAAGRADDVSEAIAAVCGGAPRAGAARHRSIAWGLFAAAWAVAVRSGAPLAACLQRFAAELSHAAALHRELGVAFAGPRSTARLVGALPLVALLFGLGMGFDTPRVLFATPVGWACLGAGLALMLASQRWSRRLLARAEPRELVPGLELELMAVAMASGASVERARGLVASVVDAYAAFLPVPAREADARALDRVLALAARAGVPTVGLLRAEAQRRRADADAMGRTAAAAVAVRLMLPLAVCVLPAFMLLGVVPVLVALFSSTGVTFG